MTFLLYELIANPQIQNTLFDELQTLKSMIEETRDDTLLNLPYLDMCIHESLRKWPPQMVS